jgi:hypothetical protein
VSSSVTLYGISCTTTSACESTGASGNTTGLAGSVPVPIFGSGTVETVVFVILALLGGTAIFVAMRRRTGRAAPVPDERLPAAPPVSTAPRPSELARPR